MNDEKIRQLAEALIRDPLAFEKYRCGKGAPAFHSDPAKVKILRAGNQWGKTRAGARETLWAMLGDHPFRDTPPPPVRGRAVCYSWDQSVEIQRRINEILPRQVVEGYDFNDRRGFVNQTLRFKNGSVLEIRTAQQGTLAHGASALDFVWVDEPPPRELYSELLARLLVKRGSMWLTTTPIGRPVEWLQDEIKAGKVADHRFDLTVENCPHLTQGQIDDIAARYLPAEKLQRLHGHFEGLTPDRFFEAFDDKQIRDEYPDQVCHLAIGIDHGERVGREFAVLIAWEKEADPPRVWCLDEYTNTKRTDPEDDAAGILAMLQRHDISPHEIDYAVGDINSAGKGFAGVRVNKALEAAIAHKLNRDPAPFYIRPAKKGRGSVQWGCRVLNYALKRGDLVIHPRCKNLIRSLRHWEGADDKYKHAIDALRYIITAALSGSKGYYKLRIER